MNLDPIILEKRWIDGESWPNDFCWKGEQRWRLGVVLPGSAGGKSTSTIPASISAFSSWIISNHYFYQELPQILLSSKDSHRLERTTIFNNPNSRLNILQSSRVRTSPARLIKSHAHTLPTHLAPVMEVLCSIQHRYRYRYKMPFDACIRFYTKILGSNKYIEILQMWYVR